MRYALTMQSAVYLLTLSGAIALFTIRRNRRARALAIIVGLQVLARTALELRPPLPWVSPVALIIDALSGMSLLAIASFRRFWREGKPAAPQKAAADAASEETKEPKPLPAPVKTARQRPAEATPVVEPTLLLPTPITSAGPKSPPPWESSLRFAQQRRDRRFPLAKEVVVRHRGMDGPGARGKMMDLSMGGARVSLQEPVESGALLCVECEGHLLLGEARYCDREPGRFFVGIRFEQPLDLARLTQLLKMSAGEESWAAKR